MSKAWGDGRFYDRDGRAVHTTSGVPCTRGWFGSLVYPPLVIVRGKLFADSGGFDDYAATTSFRLYREVPELIGEGE